MKTGEVLINEDELIRVSNNWSVVQSYYIIYHSTQALAGARCFPRPTSHIKTQKIFSNLWGESTIFDADLTSEEKMRFIQRFNHTIYA